MKRITVYTKEGCPFCSLLKLELVRREIAYDSFDLSLDEERAIFYQNTGTKTMPQVYFSDTKGSLTNPAGISLGGYSEVKNLWNSLPAMLV